MFLFLFGPDCSEARLTISGLSKDTVDSLRKKVEGRVKKIETHKSAQKPGWEVEVDKLVSCKHPVLVSARDMPSPGWGVS